jgi:hypothetical protein
LYFLPITTKFFLHHKSAFQGNLRGLGEKKRCLLPRERGLSDFFEKTWVSQGRRPGLGEKINK